MSSSARPMYAWLASGILLGGGLVLGILATVPQTEADTFVYLGLSLGLLLAIASLAAFLGIEIRRLARVSLEVRVVRQAVRQGIEIGFLLVVGSWLWVLTGLSWWEGLLLFLALAFAELAIALRRPHEAGGIS